MTRIVVQDKRYKGLHKARYIFDWKVDYRTVPNDIPLTSNVLKQYKQKKNNIGYCTFRELNKKDIISILSAVKRQEAHLNVDRMGNCAYYILHKK